VEGVAEGGVVEACAEPTASTRVERVEGDGKRVACRTFASCFSGWRWGESAGAGRTASS